MTGLAGCWRKPIKQLPDNNSLELAPSLADVGDQMHGTNAEVDMEPHGWPYHPCWSCHSGLCFSMEETSPQMDVCHCAAQSHNRHGQQLVERLEAEA